MPFCAPACALLFIALMLTSGSGSVIAQAPVHNAKVISTNLLGFGVPFEVNPNDSSIIEVQLYLSEDQGKTWSFYGRQSTDKKEFPFRTSSDGEYWFALKTLNRNRQLMPEGKTAPGLIMLVDTIKPELSFQIQNDPAGRVGCRWRAYDKNIVPEKLQILYQPMGAAADDWKQVPVQLGGDARNGLYADQVAWWPETTARSLNVRITIADAAGNQVSQDRTVSVPPTPWKHRASSTARTGSAATQFPTTNPAQQQRTAQAGEPNSVSDFRMAMNSITNGSAKNQKENSQQIGSERIGNGGLPRTAMNQSPGSTNVTLIGEPPEYAAPPVPDDFTAADTMMGQHLANQLTSGHVADSKSSGPRNSNSVTWDSEPERWNPRRRSTSSTTRQPDPRILPNPFVQQAIRKNDHLPASNPPTMKTVGDRVVGESTTMGSKGGVSNQYQGLAPLPVQESSNPPALLPGQPSNANAERIVANSEFQRQGESAFSGSANSINGQPAGGFSSAGFNRPSSRMNNGRNQNANEGAGQGGDATGMQRIRRGSGGDSSGQKRIHRPNQNDRYTGERQSVMSTKPVVDSSDPRDAATEVISTKRFRLNYGIDAIDPSGVAKVDLWMTRDGGRTWDSWGSDPDNTSPFPVEVQEEGRYGFRIVVHSKDGLTGRGPSSGDTADMWVHVDTQSPLARITSVPYGRGGEAGRLVINYSVNDPFLVLRPITLAYSRGPSGPWTMIDEGLRNEGRYVWKPTANVPDRIFLRIDARDTAGNVGVHQLSQAIDVSGLIPRGTIHGVTPVGN